MVNENSHIFYKFFNKSSLINFSRMRSKWKLPFFFKFKPGINENQALFIKNNFCITPDFFNQAVYLGHTKEKKELMIIRYMWFMKFKEFSTTRFFLKHKNPKKGQNKKSTKKILVKEKNVFEYAFNRITNQQHYVITVAAIYKKKENL